MPDHYLLPPAQFDTYSAAWLELVQQSSPTALQQSFAADTPNQLLGYVSFPIQRIVQLVSVVGGRYVRARFVMLPGSSTPQFSLVLYVTDANGSRLSAYYLAKRTLEPNILQDQVPHALVSTWLHNWQQLTQAQLDASFFQTLDGPLRGYNFELADFMDPLFQAQPFNNQQLRIYFGLHEFYSAAPAEVEQLTQTFGLVLRIYATSPEEGGTSDAPIYDVSMPCPPTC